ncbi:ornithine carbamoyltransferase [Bacillus smithii]|uniref:ornithine carbamoyltransferase n=1 Tax=Bacillus smithii TaxID=1479 RepID=UPI0030C8F2D7
MAIVHTVTAEQLKGKDLLTLADFTPDEISYFIELAIDMKKNPSAYSESLKGKILGMIFEKNSTRTRVSFEAAMIQLGGHGMFLDSQHTQIGRGETIEDTGKVLSRYLDGIMIRTFGHDKIEALAKAADIPVINGLTDLSHPCQALADLLTIYEWKGEWKGVKLVYVGDGNNVAHSLMIGAALTGMECVVATPKGFEPDPQVMKKAQALAEKTGACITYLENPKEAVKEADFIYTDVWVSMGQEKEQEERRKIFIPYQVNQGLFQYAKQDCKFMHCLPAHRGEEVSADIMDGPSSIVFQEAENRLHAQKAVLYSLLQD